MNVHFPRPLSRSLAGLAVIALTVTCGGQVPASQGIQAPAAPVATAAAPAAAPAQNAVQVLAHKVGVTHANVPKHVETIVEIDMYDNYFASPEGLKNPTFTIPSGKVVGLHFHNEGAEMHEFVIGRSPKPDGDYADVLFEKVPADIFLYYGGTARSEIGGATFGEMEIEPGLRDIWVRVTVPADLKGEWEIGCFAPEHYQKGMHAKLIVQ